MNAKALNLQERILGAVTVMNDEDRLRLWGIIADEFGNTGADWDSIPEAEPDEIDLQMLREIEEDPDCREFVSSEEVEKMTV